MALRLAIVATAKSNIRCPSIPNWPGTSMPSHRLGDYNG